MSRLALRHSLPFLATILSAACGSEFDELPGETEFRCVPSCPVNSPKINGLEIGDVKLANATSSDVKVLYAKDPYGFMYPVTTDPAEDLAVLQNGVITYSGPQMLGWTLWFEQNGVQYFAYIEDYQMVQSPIPGNRQMSVYVLKYEHPTFGRTNVCPRTAGAVNEPVVTMIRGETYDRAAKTINQTGADWLTIACTEEAAYDTKLLGYGPTSYDDINPVPFTPDQRKATLKMVTADYCGHGHSFTVQGTPISWHDVANTIDFSCHDGPFPIEAYWTAGGALCLDTPRIPAMAAEVPLYCDLPTCDEINLKMYVDEIVWVTRVPLHEEDTDSDTGDECSESTGEAP